MYESVMKEKLSKTPVFSLADLNQIIRNRDYSKKFLRNAVKKGMVKKIIRDAYTLYDDPFLVSSFIVRPSYVTSVSALSFHGLITQIPNQIYCATTRKARIIDFETKVNFVHINYFFGFTNEAYKNFSVPIAKPEKAIIDSIKVVPLNVVEEALGEINLELMIEYLKKIKKSSIIKRVGFLLDRNGFDIYEYIRDFINSKYVLFDPLLKKDGRKNKKWRVIENG